MDLLQSSSADYRAHTFWMIGRFNTHGFSFDFISQSWSLGISHLTSTSDRQFMSTSSTTNIYNKHQERRHQDQSASHQHQIQSALLLNFL
jgi:hypothetical protein